MAVFVLDRTGKALMPCSEKRARLLLARGRACIHRLVPFVIRLTDRQLDTCTLQPLRIKLDPGSKTTGLALVRDTEHLNTDTGVIQRGVAVLSLVELVHRGRHGQRPTEGTSAGEGTVGGSGVLASPTEAASQRVGSV